METKIYDFPIRVLVYPEDEGSGSFVAHALEMDIVAYGKTEQSAVRSLSELVECQISFAAQKDDDNLLLFPAPRDYFERWETAHAEMFKSQVMKDKPVRAKVKAVFISFTKQDLAKLVRDNLRPLTEHSCA